LPGSASSPPQRDHRQHLRPRHILARAGLLDGARHTHWEHQPAFSEDFPDIAVAPSLFEIDGNRITCSGGISALDMMVALIEREHGRQLAAAVGDWFLHTHIREGMGPQRMDLRLRLGVADEKLLRVLRRMEVSIEAPQLAPSLRASPAFRSTARRLFRRHWGTASTGNIRRCGGAPASARDDAACARRGACHGLRLGEPVRPRLCGGLRRAAEPTRLS
jgi:transcriptional regulator GlxA family with amidase domain